MGDRTLKWPMESRVPHQIIDDQRCPVSVWQLADVAHGFQDVREVAHRIAVNPESACAVMQVAEVKFAPVHASYHRPGCTIVNRFRLMTF